MSSPIIPPTLYSEKQMRLLTRPLYAWSGLDGAPFLALANVGMYYSNVKPAVVPDVLLKLDAELPARLQLKENRCYYVWKYGRADAVAEIVSNKEGEELGEKMKIYARVGVPYYIVWDPYHFLSEKSLHCFVLVEKTYQPCDPWFPALGLGVIEWQGTFEGCQGTWLRWRDQQGRVFPTGDERAELEWKRADQEKQRADEEKQRAEQIGGPVAGFGGRAENCLRSTMRWHSIAASVLLGFACCPAWSQDKNADAQVLEISGKKLEEWIKEIGAKDPGQRENAIRTVLYFGPKNAGEAVPAILGELRKHTPTTPIDLATRVQGAIALGVILGCIKQPDPKHVKEAVVLLQRLASDGQSIVKLRAVQALGRIGPDAKETVQTLLVAVKDPNSWETRQAAVTALGFVAGGDREPAAEVYDGLGNALKDRAAQVRLAAATSLIWLGPPSDAKLKEELIKALLVVAKNDPDPDVRKAATMASQLFARKLPQP